MTKLKLSLANNTKHRRIHLTQGKSNILLKFILNPITLITFLILIGFFSCDNLLSKLGLPNIKGWLFGRPPVIDTTAATLLSIKKMSELYVYNFYCEGVIDLKVHKNTPETLPAALFDENSLKRIPEEDRNFFKECYAPKENDPQLFQLKNQLTEQEKDRVYHIFHRYFTMSGGDKRLIIIYSGNVITGFDLAKIKKENIKISEKNIEIILPKPSIKDIIIPPSGYTIYLNEGDLGYQKIQVYKLRAKNDLLKKVHEYGIMQQSELRTIEFFNQFFKAMGYKRIKIFFQN